MSLSSRWGSHYLKYIDFSLLFIVLALLSIGLISLFSASAVYAAKQGYGSLFYVRWQSIFVLIGLGTAALIIPVDMERARKLIKPGVILAIVLLLVALLLQQVACDWRWIHLNVIRLQIGMFAKVVMILYVADFFGRCLSRNSLGPRQFLEPLYVLATMLTLIAVETDLTSAICMFSVVLLMFFSSGIKLRFLLVPIMAIIPVIILGTIWHPTRLDRIKALVSPLDSVAGSGYQITQYALAAGSGGWLGKGLGASQFKLHLPDNYTGRIFPVMLEEIGLIGGMFVVLLFITLLAKGIRIARNAPSMYLTLIALGFTLLITIQAFFNLAMSTGLIPQNSTLLPFISYGSSSMFTALIAVSVILNISARRGHIG